ncbi:Hypothetical protein CINCED_3A014530 [Cinara cedri]|uniref:Leucine-rich repeat domain, L domain-like n=1 Tax=Cinara cedri TaxID=506608 RepID=A0A5E4MUX0_9HEMI|nr:Hypothetical protein CINCED_3A014530 [Cinara cedri]
MIVVYQDRSGVTHTLHGPPDQNFRLRRISQLLCVVCFELQNILFDDEVLFSGVKFSHTLQHLSLSHCQIGDTVCLNLCRTLWDTQ